MQRENKMRPAVFAGRMLVAILLLGGISGFAATESPDELLHRADQIKLVDYSEFQTLLRQLDTQAPGLAAAQHDYLDYLHAWQLGYLGQYEDALAAFQTLLSRVQDPTLRARARISLLNDQTNAAHYEDAYVNLNALLDSLPQVKDRNAHYLILASAADLYGQAGQYDLSLSYLNQSLAYDNSEPSTCLALLTKAEVLYKSGKLHADDAQIHTGLSTCQRLGKSLYANLIRAYQAQALIRDGQAAAALQLLQAHDAEMLDTHSAQAISDFRALLARCHLLTGDIAHAREYAQSAIDRANKQTHAKSVADAWEILYEVAKRQGDDKAALAYHEQYATADKGYLDDTSARALAYQMVHQQVLDKKREIDALNEKNRVLDLQQQVNAKSAENRLLYIALLLLGLSAIALWAYRVKRSQLKFQKLARRDGLTGIYNRQHFFETAQNALRYCAKSSREASLLVLDLDHFKAVNDMHGHAAGDAVLRRAVAACQARLRSIDLFGRLGGEEFAILLPDCGQGTAAERADEMRAAIAGARRTGDAGVDVQVTASFGVATTKACGYNLPTLLAKADQALYVAKNAGRNRVSTFQAESAAAAASSSIA